MAKGKSNKGVKAHVVAPVVSSERPKKASVPRLVRKHLRQLERQLSDAARQERKRLRKLERATFRRQMLQAALEELRGETVVAIAAPPVAAPASVAATAPAASATAPASTRPAAKPRPAASRTGTPRTAAASTKAASKTPNSAAAPKATK